MKMLLDWAQQPTTVAGISTIAGTLVSVMIGQIGWPAAIPLLVGGGVGILLPDNTRARDAAVVIAQAGVAKIIKH